MNRPHILLVAVAGIAAANAYAAPASLLEASNPFAKESTLPFNYPAWDQIKNEHFAPAYEEGMRQQAAEIQAIANNKAAPTFENTIVAMERSGRLLNRVGSAFNTLTGSYTNDTLIALDKELAPKLSAHSDAIRLNPKLYARIKALYDKRTKLHLDAESQYLVGRYHTDFVRAGAKLSDADKQKLKAMNGQLAALSTQFAQNVLKESNASALVGDPRGGVGGNALLVVGEAGG
jgi:peptidyl-dipeptidase Dcp